VLVLLAHLQEFTWRRIEVTSKQAPVARSGHAATLVNNLLVIFGGEFDRGSFAGLHLTLCCADWPHMLCVNAQCAVAMARQAGLVACLCLEQASAHATVRRQATLVLQCSFPSCKQKTTPPSDAAV
jgi:hypothetical protein